MNKGIVILLISAFAAATLYYFTQETKPAPVDANTIALVERTTEIKSQVSAETAKASSGQLSKQESKQESKKKPKQKQKAKVAEQQSQSDDSYAKESLFVESEKAKEVLKASGKVRENLQGEIYIEVSSSEIMALEVGDTFKLEIPGLDMFYEIAVDQTSQDQFGNQTIEANLPDQDAKYSSIITVSNHSIYGNITTPHGIYAIEGNGQYAWIAETAGLLDGVIQDQIGGVPSTFSEDHRHTPIDTGNGKRGSTN